MALQIIAWMLSTAGLIIVQRFKVRHGLHPVTCTVVIGITMHPRRVVRYIDFHTRCQMYRFANAILFHRSLCCYELDADQVM